MTVVDQGRLEIETERLHGASRYGRWVCSCKDILGDAGLR
jgi:hypothetical protein